MSKSLFGTDGVRGEVGKEPITPETVMKLGWAAGKVLSRRSGMTQAGMTQAGMTQSDTILIGKDTRISGCLLESALQAGFCAAGVHVNLLGTMPTPAIAYLTRIDRACAGVMISASHNAYQDNGIKIFSSEGTKLPQAAIQQIELTMAQPMQCVASKDLGRAHVLPDAHKRYIEFCKRTFIKNRSLQGMKIVVDCANGAAHDIAPQVLTELGADVTAIANQPDGLNINRKCGSTDLAPLRSKVREIRADIGIALDGDADRVLMVDSAGDTINGDQLLYILTRARKRNNTLQGGVVGTLMTNLGLELALQEMAVPFVRTKVGDRFVHEALIKHHWNLGGEASGHIICLDKTTTGDGIIAALEVLGVMLETERELSHLTSGMDIFPQFMINVPIGSANGKQLSQQPSVKAAVVKAESELGKNGRVVIRASGTEPVFRIMLEGNDSAQIEQLGHKIAGEIAESVALATTATR